MTRAPDKCAIDSQFTLDTIVDVDVLMARREAAARAALESFECIRGIRYGEMADETLNIFPPRRHDASAPVQLFIHGGFWRSLDADLFSFLAPAFVPQGALLVVIDYPLMPTVRLGDVVDACRRALAWTWRHIEGFGGDPGRIYVSGNSAGGHLVAELMDHGWTTTHGLPADIVKGGCAISGLFELGPVQASFQNDVLDLTDIEVARFSPLRRRLALSTPLIAAVGGDETEEFLRQTAAFADHARSCGSETDHIVIPRANHITIVLDELANPEAGLSRSVRRQMGLDPS